MKNIMYTDKQLKQISNWSKFIGFSIITISVITSFFNIDDVNIVNSTVGGMGIGVLLAFIVPFWLGKLSKYKSFKKYL